MCGIVGLFLKNPALRPELGTHVSTMLAEMTSRGPDSAGIAVYHRPTVDGVSKFTLFHDDDAYAWDEMTGRLGEALGVESDLEKRAKHVVLAVQSAEEPVR